MDTFALVVGAAFFSNVLTVAWVWGIYGMTRAEQSRASASAFHYAAAAIPPLLAGVAIAAYVV